MDSLAAGMAFPVHFETLGCRLNQIESEAAARRFADAGFDVDMEALTAASPVSGAVLCVLNTCTVTGKAEQKARRLIRLLLRKCPAACVLVTGCYAELDAPLIASIGDRVCVLPGSRKDALADIPERLARFLRASEGDALPEAASTASFLRSFAASLRPEEKSAAKFTPADAFRLSTDSFFVHSRASVKVQDGCDNSCAYCRIHLARGRAVSLDAAAVVARVARLEGQGHHEAVLTGVNLSQYRGALGGGFVDLAGLLEILVSSTSRIRFRLSSLHPDRVDDALCRAVASPRVQPHFHLSVQSGSGRILSLMGRSYGPDRVLEAVRRLREAKRDPFIACDMIAGFPGETDEDFGRTMELCRSAAFSWVHAFPFSARPGTRAFSMRPAVPQRTAAGRVARLTEFAIESKCSYISLWSGKEVTAVTELSRSDRVTAATDSAPALTHGVTENFLHVELAGAYPPGSLLRVRIGEPLVSEIRRGGEREAAAEAIEVIHDDDDDKELPFG